VHVQQEIATKVVSLLRPTTCSAHVVPLSEDHKDLFILSSTLVASQQVETDRFRAGAALASCVLRNHPGARGHHEACHQHNELDATSQREPRQTPVCCRIGIESASSNVRDHEACAPLERGITSWCVRSTAVRTTVRPALSLSVQQRRQQQQPQQQQQQQQQQPLQKFTRNRWRLFSLSSDGPGGPERVQTVSTMSVEEPR
jgi:hypothetical protein